MLEEAKSGRKFVIDHRMPSKKIRTTAIKVLRQLGEGQALAAGSLPAEILNPLLVEKLIYPHGSTRSYSLDMKPLYRAALSADPALFSPRGLVGWATEHPVLLATAVIALGAAGVGSVMVDR